MTSQKFTEQVYAALNKLVKWKNVFSGWQLGTRLKGDPECDAIRDHREVTILLRAEVSALVKCLVDMQVFSEEQFQRALFDEAKQLDKDYEEKFPGMQTTDIGVTYDKRALETMKHWLP